MRCSNRSGRLIRPGCTDEDPRVGGSLLSGPSSALWIEGDSKVEVGRVNAHIV